MLDRLLRTLRKEPDKPITRLYLLVHPFYNFRDDMQIKEYKERWMDSVSDASKEKGTFAMSFLDPVRPSKHQLEIAKHMTRSFGKNRSNVISIYNIYPDTVYDENIMSRILDPDSLIITSRAGVLQIF